MAAAEGRRALKEPRRNARDEDGRDEERHRVDPVRGVRSRGGGEQAAEDRADGPAQVLDRLQQRVGIAELRLGHEVRDACVDGRTEEARRETGDECQRDDLARVRRERQCREDRGAQQVRRDHQPAALEPVEQRAEREADEDARQDLHDQHGADPEARVRPVLDVDRERDRRQKGADRRPEGRDRQQAKTRVAERQQLTADSCQGAPDANTLSGALRDA